MPPPVKSLSQNNSLSQIFQSNPQSNLSVKTIWPISPLLHFYESDLLGCVQLQGYTSCGTKQDITSPTVYYGKNGDDVYVDQCIAQSFASQGSSLSKPSLHWTFFAFLMNTIPLDY